MNGNLITLYSVTSSHIGCETALGLIDNPIQRERHTNWPIIPASGFKGALRHAFLKSCRPSEGTAQDITSWIFGSEDPKNAYAGSLVLTDINLLAFPMRSSKYPFVWVTSPSVLNRFISILNVVAGKNEKNESNVFESVDNEDAISLLIAGKKQLDKILLEDLLLTVKYDETLTEKFGCIKKYFGEINRLYLVSDEVFNYCVTDCTQVLAQIKIDPEKGVTAEGSLRYQEELPADCLMYSSAFWQDSYGTDSLKYDGVKKYICDTIPDYLQIGGDASLGRGLFKITWEE